MYGVCVSAPRSRQEVGFFDAPENSPGALATQLSADAALVQATTGAHIAQWEGACECTVLVTTV